MSKTKKLRSKKLDELEDWSDEEIDRMTSLDDVSEDETPKKSQKSTKPTKTPVVFKDFLKKHRKRQSLADNLNTPLNVLGIEIRESEETGRDGKPIKHMDLHCGDGKTYYTSSKVAIGEMEEYIEVGGAFPTILTARQEGKYFTFMS